MQLPSKPFTHTLLLNPTLKPVVQVNACLACGMQAGSGLLPSNPVQVLATVESGAGNL